MSRTSKTSAGHKIPRMHIVFTVESVGEVQWKTLSQKEKIPRWSELKEETQYGLLVSTCMCTHVHGYAFVQVHICMNMHIHVCIHTHTWTHTHYSCCHSSSVNTVLKWSQSIDYSPMIHYTSLTVIHAYIFT